MECRSVLFRSHGAAGSTGSFTVDTVTPTVTVSTNHGTLNLATNTATISFAFSEAPTTFVLADTTATGGTLSGLTMVDATHYTATFTAAGSEERRVGKECRSRGGRNH